MTRQEAAIEILKLLDDIKRFENKTDEYFNGWRSALDTVEVDVKEWGRGER